MSSLSWAEEIPYFPRSELACKGDGTILLDIRFAIQLPYLRNQWGAALTPTSVCRTPAHNKAEGGHPRSLHLTENPIHPTNGAMAADILWRDWDRDTRIQFARLAWSLGWSVGLHDIFCHIDRRIDIGLNQAVFLYGRWSNQFTPQEVMS